MNGVIIGQALYGERAKGHALLSASPAATDVAPALVYRMDVQGTVPPGTRWSPFLTGFPHEDHYVLARTAPDTGGRPGMVRSHALFLPRVCAGRLDGLDGLIGLLGDPGGSPLPDLAMPVGSDGGGSPHRGLVAALMADGEGPVVWPFETGFEAALVDLWRNLWPEARADLDFRLAFTPADLAGRAPAIVTTPPSLAGRWAGFRVVQAEAAVTDEAAALLTGEQDPLDLRALVAQVGAGLRSASDLHLVADVARALRGSCAMQEIVGALRLLCHVAPERAAAGEAKAALVDSAARAMATATASQVRTARNLDLAAVADPSRLWKALADWAATALWSDHDAAVVARTLADASRPDGPVAEWRKAVGSGVDRLLAGLDAPDATAVWRIVASEPPVLAQLGESLRRHGRAERALADAVPAHAAEGSVQAWLEVCAAAGLIQLHGACCAAFLKPRDAVARHIVEVEPNEESLLRSLHRATPADLVSVALAHGLPLLMDRAAKAAAAKPSLLAGLDLENGNARGLWQLSVSREPDAWSGLRNVRAGFAELLGRMADGEVTDEPLLVALSATPLANLLDQPRRAELWGIIPSSARGAYLSATADAWVEAFVRAPDEQALEQPLAAHLAAGGRVAALLARLEAEPVAGCILFRTFPELSQSEFVAWVDRLLTVVPSLDAAACDALGRLVAARSWSAAAEVLADAAIGGRDDLRACVAYFPDLLVWWRRYMLDLFFGTTPAFAKWRTLEELAIELYGFGPKDGAVWTRAGGKEGDIPQGETGADQWRKVFANAERGARPLDIRRLVAVMADDYRANQMLQKMRYDSFYG